MKTKKFWAVLISSAMVLGALAGCGGSSSGASTAASSAPAKEEAAAEETEAAEAPAADAAEGEPINIKISTVLTEASCSGRALQMLADELKEKSGGRITSEIYYNGVLADSDTCFTMACEGEIQMVTGNPVAYETQVTELATLDEYYMFDDLDHAHRFFEGDGGAYLDAAWNKVGLQGLGIYGLGFRELSNGKKEIKTVEDMAGLTIRGYSPIQIDAWAAAGAAPTSVDWNELFVSMQQGLLDGQESALSTINDFSFYEVQKYITMTDHVFTMDWVLCNKEWYDGLAEADRALFDECVKDAYEWQKETYQAELAELADKFTNEYGITITELDPEVKQQLRDAMGPVTVESIKDYCGEDVYNTVHEFVEAAR